MAPQIDNSHDWAIWLLENLEGQQQVLPGQFEGSLPGTWDFVETAAALGNYGLLVGMTDAATRTIEFYPSRGKVFSSLQEMFAYPANLRTVPSRFTLRDFGFTYDAQADEQGILVVPPQVTNYLAAAKLCTLLPLLADMATNSGESQHFIRSPESRIEVKLVYQVDDLTPLASLTVFETEFAATTHHKDQKRSIVRSVLLDAFKSKRSITMGEILPKFENLVEEVRSNYSMYAAEFSFEKIKAEVEKDNLDSTLKLNKTLSEIQNQLLAMPVALVLVGGQMTPDTSLSIKNVVIWLGACVFGGLMLLLIRNQRHAIEAITEEIRLRKIKVDAQPDGMAGKFKSGFEELQKRAKTQTNTLRGLGYGVFAMVLLATGLLAWFSMPEWHKSPIAGAPAQSSSGGTAVVQATGAASAAASLSSAKPATSSPLELAIQDMKAANAASAPASQRKP
jgi:hypothetical protein